MTRTPKVAAIVLNYNGRDITLQALDSLTKMTYPACDIIHVDNGSNDGSTAAITEAYPQVRTIREDQNIGPAGGLNLGMRAALESNYEYLLFLNNDIEVDPEMLSELVRVAEGSQDIGCVGPKAYYFWDRNRLWSAGGNLHFRESATTERGMGEIDQGQYDQEEDVDYINGCAILIRRSALEKVGYWDPQFQLAGEDADLCMRLKQKGFRCTYSPRAVLWHMVAQTAGSYEARRTFGTGRSTALFVRRYGSFRDWLTFVMIMGAALPLAFLRELPKGNQGAVIAKFKGVLTGLRTPLYPPPDIDAPIEATRQ